MGSRLADLVFGPTLACGGDRGPSGRLAPSPDRIAPIGAGLTSKPHHAQRPRVALRGSFRLRLASTTGDDPRATTDPDESPVEYSERVPRLISPERPSAIRPVSRLRREGSVRTRRRSSPS